MTDVSHSSQTLSAHEIETFNVENEKLRERTERSVADHDKQGGHRLPNSRIVKCAQSTSVPQIDSEN